MRLSRTRRALMEIDRGWLDRARRRVSPNCDARPPHTVIDLLVIHGISLPPRHFGGPWVDALFTNTLDIDAHPYFERLAGFRVSAHILIRRDGELVQYVPFHLRAWHAGASCYEGRVACNDFSIGIELEGCDDLPYSDPQYVCLAQVITALQRDYPAVTDRRIVGHSDIAQGRKTDPGPAFDWTRLRAELEGHRG